MDNPFFSHPILNSPYEYPSRHWELDDSGQLTNRILDARRRVSFISPIPKPRKRRGAAAEQASLVFDEASRKLADGGSSTTLRSSSTRYAGRSMPGAASPTPTSGA